METAISAGAAVEKSGAGARTALNFWVDLSTAILFAGLLGSGILMKWILPPGTCDAPGVKVWLGHSRHWWGDIHFWIAVALLALMIVHIWLHWSWVVSVWGKLVGSVKSPKTWAAAGAMALLIAVPFIVPASYLEVPQATEASSHDDPAVQDAAAGVAPCGVEGLSCDDCPAADDRLFGGTCITTLYEEQQGADDGSAGQDEATAETDG